MQAEVDLVQRELVKLIAENLKANKLPLDKARQLAADFLKLLPIKDQMDLLKKLQNLGTTYPEAEAVYVEELGRVEENQTDLILDQMRNFIKQGDINQAINTAKSFYKGGVA